MLNRISQVHRASQKLRGPGILRADGDDLCAPRGTTCCSYHTRPGHPLVTSGTGPPADNYSDECPETRASGILRFKVGKCIRTRTTPSAVSCTINSLILKTPPSVRAKGTKLEGVFYTCNCGLAFASTGS